MRGLGPRTHVFSPHHENVSRAALTLAYGTAPSPAAHRPHRARNPEPDRSRSTRWTGTAPRPHCPRWYPASAECGPAAPASCSSRAISPRPSPTRRAPGCPSSFCTSARCGWFGGVSRSSITVPVSSPSLHPPSKTRFPVATSVATRRQNPSAAPFGNGGTNHTEAPASTHATRSRSTAARPRRHRPHPAPRSR